MQPILKLKNIEVKFPVKRSFISMLSGKKQKKVNAVNGINLEVNKREILALVGESGSGKTTLGKVVDVLHPKGVMSGSIEFNGKTIFKSNGQLIDGYRQAVCMIFQDPYQSLNPKHTIEKIVAEPLIVNKITSDKVEIKKRVIEALESSGLSPAEDFMYRYPHELSGGQRQRVVIAGALIMEPKLIIADEPVSMLDVSIRADILKLMMKLRDEKDITYIFITHDISLAWAISDKIGVMYLGNLLEYGNTDDVISRPLNPYTHALIDIMPKMNVLKTEKRMLLKGEVPNPIDLPTGCVFHPRCPKATEKCELEKPTLLCDTGVHFVACHHPDNSQKENSYE